MRIGWLEFVLIFLVLLVVLGPGKFTGIFKGFKEGLANFKKSVSSDEE